MQALQTGRLSFENTLKKQFQLKSIHLVFNEENAEMEICFNAITGI